MPTGDRLDTQLVIRIDKAMYDELARLAEANDRPVAYMARQAIRRHLDDLAALDTDPDNADRRPHSRACGIAAHDHGPACSTNCPTCHGKALA